MSALRRGVTVDQEVIDLVASKGVNNPQEFGMLLATVMEADEMTIQVVAHDMNSGKGQPSMEWCRHVKKYDSTDMAATTHSEAIRATNVLEGVTPESLLILLRRIQRGAMEIERQTAERGSGATAHYERLAQSFALAVDPNRADQARGRSSLEGRVVGFSRVGSGGLAPTILRRGAGRAHRHHG